MAVKMEWDAVDIWHVKNTVRMIVFETFVTSTNEGVF